jgi:hypothetical protein
MKVLKEFENSEKTLDLIKITLDHLQKNPPTLGHGFSHLAKTARAAYQIASLNKPGLCEKAYVAGLLHDIYRPATGEAGQENHEKIGSKIAKELIKNSGFSNYSNEIYDALYEKDEQILNGKSSTLTQILSIADKIQMSFQMGVSYTWASNSDLISRNKPIAYHNFIETTGDFIIYQRRAWNIFRVVNIKGVENAIYSYIETNKDSFKAVKLELEGKINYPDESVKIAKKEAKLDLTILKHFGANNTISGIVKNYSELI